MDNDDISALQLLVTEFWKASSKLRGQASGGMSLVKARVCINLLATDCPNIALRVRAIDVQKDLLTRKEDTNDASKQKTLSTTA